jgi:hypothetical protein
MRSEYYGNTCEPPFVYSYPYCVLHIHKRERKEQWALRRLHIRNQLTKRQYVFLRSPPLHCIAELERTNLYSQKLRTRSA